MQNTLKHQFFVLVLLFATIQFNGQSKEGYLTKDGAWCWFSDPRAILVDNTIYTGWVKNNGTVEAASFDLDSKKAKFSDLYFMLEKDDHDNPAFTVTSSGDILAMYARHGRRDFFINRLKDYRSNRSFSEARLLYPISKEELKKYPNNQVTYANPYRLKSENDRIYCFGRWTGFKPNVMWSDDDGYNWTKSKVFITNIPFDRGNRPYVKYYSDGDSKVHMMFTDGHPRNEPINSVYYAYYENGAFYKANGEQICSMKNIPFEPKDASTVYTSNQKEGRAWIADIAEDENGNPVLLYTKSPTEENHEYWYAKYTEQGWINKKLCDSGKWFPKTEAGKVEREPHYFGGLSLHPDNTNVVYLSRQIKGVFEIERWETKNNGKSWKKEAITTNSTFDNVRPYLPRGLSKTAPEIVLWMENENYIHFKKDYKVSIKYLIKEK